MKFNTIITRYKNLGYAPKNIEPEIEIECLINWIFKTYDIYINLVHSDLNKCKQFKKINPNMDLFCAHTIHNCNAEYSESFYSDKYFNNPFDAKFKAIVDLYSSIKFQYH